MCVCVYLCCLYTVCILYVVYMSYTTQSSSIPRLLLLCQKVLMIPELVDALLMVLCAVVGSLVDQLAAGARLAPSLTSSKP